MFICLSVNPYLLGMSKSADLAQGQGKQSECGDEYYEEIEEKNYEKEKIKMRPMMRIVIRIIMKMIMRPITAIGSELL